MAVFISQERLRALGAIRTRAIAENEKPAHLRWIVEARRGRVNGDSTASVQDESGLWHHYVDVEAAQRWTTWRNEQHSTAR